MLCPKPSYVGNRLLKRTGAGRKSGSAKLKHRSPDILSRGTIPQPIYCESLQPLSGRGPTCNPADLSILYYLRLQLPLFTANARHENTALLGV